MCTYTLFLLGVYIQIRLAILAGLFEFTTGNGIVDPCPDCSHVVEAAIILAWQQFLNPLDR